MSTDWNAEQYHEISEPQFRWGLAVLETLELRGDETVLDAGCGSGRLTAELFARLPKGRVIALDASPSMLDAARTNLARFGDRVSFVSADLTALELDRVADVVFSNATFHWVLDHDALFRGLYRALKPGGRLHAQCGGEGNLRAHLATAFEVATHGPWAAPSTHLGLTNFAGAEASVERMTAAGFTDARAWLKDAPTPFPDPQAFARFITHVTLRTFVGALGEAAAKGYVDAVTRSSAPAYTLDYVRLELRGQRP